MENKIFWKGVEKMTHSWCLMHTWKEYLCWKPGSTAASLNSLLERKDVMQICVDWASPSHGSGRYLPGEHSGAPIVFSLKRETVSCHFWTQCLLITVWRHIPLQFSSVIPLLCFQSWHASVSYSLSYTLHKTLRFLFKMLLCLCVCLNLQALTSIHTTVFPIRQPSAFVTKWRHQAAYTATSPNGKTSAKE